MKKMLIWVSIFFLCTALTGCFQADNSKQRAFEKDWGFNVTIYAGGMTDILDEETAITIATIYINEKIESSGYAAGYHYESIKYNSNNKAWLVTFAPEEDSNQLPCHVALGTNGALLGIAWGNPIE